MQIRDLKDEDVYDILTMMSEFPESYPLEYLYSQERGSVLWLLRYAVYCQGQDDACEEQEVIDINESEYILFRLRGKYDMRSFVLADDDKAVGHLAYHADRRAFGKDVYEIMLFIVKKELQGRGYGTKLYQHTIIELQDIGARKVWGQTGKKHIPFLEKLGFKFLYEWVDYYGPNRHRYLIQRILRP